jgi:hypothetical protein
MLPPQLETGQVAGPHSAGSSAGRLAKGNRTFIQAIAVAKTYQCVVYGKFTAIILKLH